MRIITLTPSCLTLLLALASQLGAQQPEPLVIKIVAGEGAINNVKAKTSVPPRIEVKDTRGRIVSAARVVFTLPEFGPGGKFADGAHTSLAWTDSEGRATSAAIVPNDSEGPFNIKVVATYTGSTATAVIPQVNSATGGIVPKKKSNKKVLILAGVAGGAVAGIFAARGGGHSTPTAVVAPPPPTLSIGIGTVTIGGPK